MDLDLGSFVRSFFLTENVAKSMPIHTRIGSERLEKEEE